MRTLALLLLVVVFSGCGSNFEWFPEGSAFNNNSTATVPVTAPGTVMWSIPFPAGVQSVSDIAYDKSTRTFWMLAGTSSATPNVLVQLDGTRVFRTVYAANWPLTVVDGSTLAYDGVYFWITSGVNVSEIYLILLSEIYGIYQNNKYPCAASISGLCRGLAWDSTTSSLWSAGSDNTTLVKYQELNGLLFAPPLTYTNLWTGSGVTDVSFDSVTGQVFVIRNGVIVVQGSSGTKLGTISFTVPGSGRGDWDGRYFWVVDNTSKSIKALFVR